MATYRETQITVEGICGCSVKTCWIADVKEQLGLRVRRGAWNRQHRDRRLHPCPDRFRAVIIGVLRQLQVTK